MSATASISNAQLDSTFGCVFLAAIFTTALWGVGCLQLYLYYERYWKVDQAWLRVYVFMIWVFDTVHQCLVLSTDYGYFVRGLGNPAKLLLFPKTAVHVAIFTAVVDFMVQTVFIRRAWYLSNKNRILVAALGTAVLGQFVATTVYFGKMYNFTQIKQLDLIIATEVAMNCTMVFTDTFLASVLVWYLWKGRSGFRRTDSIINRLVMYTVGTGLLTSFWMIAALISAELEPHSFIYLVADLTLPKLYFNCMMASLNVRSSLRRTQDLEVSGMSFRLENVSRSGGTSDATYTANQIKSSVPDTKECRIDIRGETETSSCEKPRGIDTGETTLNSTSTDFQPV